MVLHSAQKGRVPNPRLTASLVGPKLSVLRIANLRWLGEQPTTQVPSVSRGLTAVCS